MIIGIGVGINRQRYMGSFSGAYQSRVTADGAIVESISCVGDASSLLQSASLLLIPSGYKGGKLYAEIPTNGNGDLTWTRGGDAFRTNASGVLQRVPWNLFQRSEEFDNAAWIKTNITLSTNATNAPNGTLTAEKAIQATGLSEHYLRQQVNSLTGVYTASIYAKKAELDFLILWEDVTTGKRACFNLSNGTIGLTSNSPNATITNVGDGWYRCTIEATLSSQGFGLYLAPSQTNTVLGLSQTGNGTSGVFIWGAQLVEGTTAQTYLPTTDRLNFPRLSYMYGSCPSALLEPQRTNLVLWSEDFTNSAWIKGTGVSVTANTTIAPDGNQTADTITFTGSNQLMPQVCLTVGTNVTTSVWLKGTAGETILINGGGGADVTVTLTTSWQRVSFNRASTTTTSVNISTFGGVTARSVQIWGFQAEIGSYPTTYIPTTSATATRVADSFSRSNIYTNGLISASGGTWFVELRNNVAYTRDSVAVNLFLGDNISSPSNALVIRSASASATRLSIQKVIAGAFTILATPSTDTIKVAFKWNGTSADVFVNGTKEVSATAYTTTNMEFLSCISQIPTFIQQMALFPTPLTDAQCQTLTT